MRVICYRPVFLWPANDQPFPGLASDQLTTVLKTSHTQNMAPNDEFCQRMRQAIRGHDDLNPEYCWEEEATGICMAMSQEPQA